MPFVKKTTYAARRAPVRRYRPARKLNYRQKSQVKRLITRDQEIKFADTAILNSPTTAGLIAVMSEPGQGSAAQQRVGDNITLKNLEVDVNFTAGDATNVIRMIIFRWSQNNSVTAPTVLDVLQYANVMSPLNHDTVDQSKITVCYDAVVPLVLAGSNGTRTIRKKLWGRKLGRKKMVFNSGGLTTGLYMWYYLLISDSVAAPHPSVGGYLRMNYVDD